MADNRPVLILGAAGFIGRALAARLAASGIPVVAACRTAHDFGPGIETRVTGTLSAKSDWPHLVQGTRAIVHLASRAHAPAGANEQWIWDDAATGVALAAAAHRARVERLVLMSSIKVHGESSGAGRFSAADAPAPADPYGRAKAMLEETMREAASSLVVLRPPLVYGPGVPANFLALMRLVARGLPLPIASIANRRSLIFIDNLVDLVALALTHERAPGRVFLLRDDEEASTPELVRLIGRGLGRTPLLLPCPPVLLRAGARLLGKGEMAARLLDSLSVDDGATRATLGWRPRVALADGIAATCRGFRGAGAEAPH